MACQWARALVRDVRPDGASIVAGDCRGAEDRATAVFMWLQESSAHTRAWRSRIGSSGNGRLANYRDPTPGIGSAREDWRLRWRSRGARSYTGHRPDTNERCQKPRRAAR